MIGHTSDMRGVINSLHPSTQTPKASMAARRMLGSAAEKYCWMRERRAGKTCLGGRDVDRPSMIRRADYSHVSMYNHAYIDIRKDVHEQAHHHQDHQTSLP